MNVKRAEMRAAQPPEAILFAYKHQGQVCYCMVRNLTIRLSMHDDRSSSDFFRRCTPFSRFDAELARIEALKHKASKEETVDSTEAVETEAQRNRADQQAQHQPTLPIGFD
ncbi:hypothetical protein BFJ70_g2506 [Fusarium oxysporum]|nr:hypothetical protein BFJ70_g2506 [Fusarium oxysporum]